MGARGHGLPSIAYRDDLDAMPAAPCEHGLAKTGGSRWQRIKNHTAAPDATVQVQADTHTQRAMWLMVCSIADAYGFGPKQLQKFFTALQDNTDELERMRAEVDEEYAFEKLRQKAQAVTGMEVHYLYEQEALLAEMQAAKEGVLAHE